MRLRVALVTAVLLLPMLAFAEDDDGDHNGSGSACKGLPSYGKLKAALEAAVSAENSGLNLHMWATIVNRDGVVCAVAFSGVDRGAQWPGSRVISAQKANTANSFSLDSTASISGSGPAFPPLSSPAGLVLSTANLYNPTQPGNSLFGLQESNPVDTQVAYKGPSVNYGRSNDPMVGDKIGGVNVFGGGLALYASGKKIVGGVGVSGDTSCADHFIAWRLRNILELDHLLGVAGVSGDANRPDNIILDLTNGFGHPSCINTGVPGSLPAVRP
jgi:uncharacterized protein GlcG (DUF336 family)